MTLLQYFGNSSFHYKANFKNTNRKKFKKYLVEILTPLFSDSKYIVKNTFVNEFIENFVYLTRIETFFFTMNFN